MLAFVLVWQAFSYQDLEGEEQTYHWEKRFYEQTKRDVGEYEIC